MPNKDSDPNAAIYAAAAAAMNAGPKAMTEREFMEVIRREVRSIPSLVAFHAPDIARRLCWGRGFPDLVIAGPRGVLFREVKTSSGETTAEQDLWGWTLRQAGADWGLWRPADFESGRIRRELAVIASG